MSLQRSHTSSGITPARMSIPNVMHPRQIPNADSNVAAAISRPSTATAAVQ